MIDALGNVRRLFVNGDHHGTGLMVEPILRPRIADPLDCLAYDIRDGDISGSRHLAAHDHQAGGNKSLARHPTHGVIGIDGIQDGVGYLIGHFVGVAFSHRLGSKNKIPSRHTFLLIKQQSFLPADRRKLAKTQALSSIGSPQDLAP